MRLRTKIPSLFDRIIAISSRDIVGRYDCVGNATMQLKRPGYRVIPVVGMLLLMLLSISGFPYLGAWGIVDRLDLLNRKFEVSYVEISVI